MRDSKVLVLNVETKEKGGIKDGRVEKDQVCKAADTWIINGKKMVLQMKPKDSETTQALVLPDEVKYPPERAARIPGCEPLRRLKSARATLFEKLAPFAPIAALLIGAILFVIVIGGE